MAVAGASPANVVIITADKGVARAIEALPAPRPHHRRELTRTANDVFRLTPTFEQSTARLCLSLA